MHPSVKLLRELIALPSVNPAFLPAGDARAGEKQVADYLVAVSAQAGLDVELQAVAPGRNNVLARLQPVGICRQRVILAPHMDTVGGNAPGIYVPRVQNGRIYGRGACDTKGSVACMLEALVRLARAANRPRHTEIMLAALVDEENAQMGSRTFADSGIEGALAIVGEPTQLRVVTAHKGDVWLRLLTRGKAAHGSRPELGVNAVHRMARVVELLENQYARQLRARRHRLLGCGTINVGAIAGGVQPNIVPDLCQIDIDRRTLPGESERDVRREIRQLLEQHQLKAIFVSLRGGPSPALETNIRVPLVRALLEVAGQKGALGVDYFCDAAVLARGGIPSVVFGPGNIAQAHTVDEWISIRQVEYATDLLLTFLRSLP